MLKPRLLSHRLFVGRTQSGKTSQMLAGLEDILRPEIAEGKLPTTGLTVIDAKGSSLWLGAGSLTDKDNTSSFIWVRRDQPETLLAAKAKLEYIVKKVMPYRAATRMRCLESGVPYRPRPHILIIEEWLILLSIAREYDALYTAKGGKSIEQWFINTVIGLIVSGLEDGLEIWISTQDPTTERNKFSPDCRNNFIFNCFGGPERGYSSITSAIGNQYIVDPSFKPNLLKRLNQARAQRLWAVLSNHCDPASGDEHWNLYRAPAFDPRIKGKILFRGPGSVLPNMSGLSIAQPAKVEEIATEDKSKIIQFPDRSNLTLVEEFSEQSLSEAAQRLLKFVRRQNRIIKLQEACKHLPAEWRRAEVVHNAAQECVDAGLATLIENPNYPNSFYFELIEEDAESDSERYVEAH